MKDCEGAFLKHCAFKALSATLLCEYGTFP